MLEKESIKSKMGKWLEMKQQLRGGIQSSGHAATPNMRGARCCWSANLKIQQQHRGGGGLLCGCVRRCYCCCWANQYFCDVATQATANDSKHHEKIWEQGRGKK